MQGADQASDLHTAPRQPSRQWTQAGLLGKVKSISPPQRASPSPASTTTKYAPRQKAASEWKPEPSFIPPARKMGLGKQVPGLIPVRTGWKRVSKVCVTPCQLPVTKWETDLRIRHLYFGNMTIFTLCFWYSFPFYSFSLLVKFILKMSTRRTGTKVGSFVSVPQPYLWELDAGWKQNSRWADPGESPLPSTMLSFQSSLLPHHGGFWVWLLWYVRVVPSQYCIGNDWWMLDPLGGGAGGDGRCTVWTGFSSLSLLGGERFLVGGDWVFRCLSLQQLPLSSLASFVT